MLDPLVRAYRTYNRKYFSSALPPVDQWTIRWSAIDNSTMGYCDFDEEEIVIHKNLKNTIALWRLTLLHEMAHLHCGLKASHGHKFQAEMLRLANAGAFNGLW